MKKIARLAFFSVAFPQMLCGSHRPIPPEKTVILLWVFPRAICFKGDRDLKLTSNLLLVPGLEYVQRTHSLPHMNSSYRNCVFKMYIIICPVHGCSRQNLSKNIIIRTRNYSLVKKLNYIHVSEKTGHED
jgi:hypothetical protein